MDLPCVVGVCFLRSARGSASRYGFGLFYDNVRRWLLGSHPRSATAHIMSAKLRSYGFTPGAVLVLTVLMAWAGVWIWRHLARLQRDFTVVQSESFHLAEHLEEKMLTLKETARSLDVHPDPAAMADFQKEATEMDLWIQTNRLLVTSAEQRNVLDRIGVALDGYVLKTRRILEENTRAGSGVQPKPVLERVEQEAAQVLGLARELRVAEQVALDRFVKDSRGAMGSLYAHVLVSVGLALVLGLAALRLIHIARIAPLKAELLQSHSILEQKEKLASLGTLVAGVAHEVRNPLTAIKVRLHSLKRAFQGDLSASDDIGVIHDEINRLEDIVGGFLEFARPSAPRMRSFAAEVLCHRVDHLLRPQLEAAGIQWKIEASPELSMRADLQQIEQVLINLIQNAAESTERGGSVTLRASTRQERWPAGMAAATVLDVVDTGKGIAPEVAKRMFDPFYSTKENGAGLGLSIAARIVEQHGGLLRYQTKPGLGTTFSVILPINEESKHGS